MLNLILDSKKNEKIGVIAVKLETLLGKKIIFIYYWFNIITMKVDEIKLLVCQKN